jgi:hypothetical protein
VQTNPRGIADRPRPAPSATERRTTARPWGIDVAAVLRRHPLTEVVPR